MAQIVTGSSNNDIFSSNITTTYKQRHSDYSDYLYSNNTELGRPSGTNYYPYDNMELELELILLKRVTTP